MAMKTISRRQALKFLGAGTALFAWPGLTAAATGRDTRLIVVIQRGGMDGLAAVPPYGEPALASLRGELNTGSPGSAEATLKLDGLFGLHPALKDCAQGYERGDFAVVHAVAPPYHGRSHFEAQDCLENGGDSPHQFQEGWLNRAVAALGGAEGLAVASSMPLILRGSAAAETWSPSALPQPSDDLVNRVAALYARDRLLAPAFQRATGMENTSPGDLKPEGGRERLPEAMRAAARFMTGRHGLRAVVLQDGGWDTHARQGAGKGLLAGKLTALDQSIAVARTELGALWNQTLVVVATEFGRMAHVNGSGGTDHGTGGVMLLAGGALRGGKVYGDWPGLTTSALLDGRDLRPTTDSRAVFKALLRDHLGVPEAALADHVFPGSRAIKPLDGLVRTWPPGRVAR
jgi:uncharacterized protein (DUF1501 family)